MPVTNFIVNCFSFISYKQRDSRSDEGSGELIVRQKMIQTDVRRTLVILGREFASGSIAGGVMRDVRSIKAMKIIITELRKFISCSHTSNASIFCIDCCKALFISGRHTEKFVPCAGRFAQALADSAMSRTDCQLRGLGAFTASLMELAIVTRSTYLVAFDHIKVAAH